MAAAKRILVIDDADDVRRLVQRQLQSLGYETRGAMNGEDGLRLVEEEVPDLVLCDLRMPRVDGLTVLRTLQEKHPHLPVVVVSGEGVFNDAIEALRAGAWDYLTKPVSSMAVLGHAVSKALEKAELLNENQAQRKRLEVLYRELAEDHAAGRLLQQSLLPMNGMQLGSFTLTRELIPSMYLSGDFLDAFTIDESRWAFYLVDVAGHGVPSALVTVMMHTLVDRKVFERPTLSPASLLTELNASLLAQGHDKHVSFFFGIVDERENTLCCANAGAFPYPLLVQGGEATLLELPSMPLGLMPNAEYEERTWSLRPDAKIAAVTDGVFEVISAPTQEEKIRRIASLVLGANDARALIATLGIDEQSTRPDDIAVLMLTRRQ